MPDLSGIHHVSLSVTDIDAATDWYADVLGFELLGKMDGDDWVKAFMAHAGLSARLTFTAHPKRAFDRFDETAPGLDHLSFAVPTAEDLDAWVERFSAKGVEQSPIADSFTIPGAKVLVFRDPDGVQLELYFDPGFTG